MFGSALSIALASLSVTVLAEGLKAADDASFGMIRGCGGDAGLLRRLPPGRPVAWGPGRIFDQRLPAWGATAALLALVLLR